MKKTIKEDEKLMSIIHSSSDWIDAFEKIEPYKSNYTESNIHDAVFCHFFKKEQNINANKQQQKEA